MSETVVVNEIYLSVQGESTFAGLPCVFVRLTGCDLRCSYCDTAYAFSAGRKMMVEEVVAEVRRLGGRHGRMEGGVRLPLVEVTGGEPLLQRGAPVLMKLLCDEGHTLLLETSGAHDIGVVDERVHRIVDLKCPSSGESGRNLWSNLDRLKGTDEVKFVVGTVEDYEWVREQLEGHRLHLKCPVLVSWVAPLGRGQRDPSLRPVPEGQTPLSRRELVERIIADALPVRFQLQMHKVIWDPERQGV